MSEKRRDSKNRILHNGETQMTDGRYRYRYVDANGIQQNIYSWRLDKNDRIPAGKKSELSLREKEKLIQEDLFEQIVSNGGNYTVLDIVKKYTSIKVGVRDSTKAGYNTVIKFLSKDDFGKKRIDKVTMSDAKLWLVDLQKNGKGYSTIHTIRGVLRPAFRMAYDDNLIRKNPFDFELADIIVNDSVTREAISREQERNFLNFLKNDKHYSQYYDVIYILFNTGVRISEFCGITKKDIDFKKKCVNINKQLRRNIEMKYYIEKPKTESGNRIIPMTADVEKCFKNIISNRPTPKTEIVIDGFCGFLCLDKNNMPKVAMHWEHCMKDAVNKYNSIYKEELPDITPHVCRHTFCTKMAKSGMNPKTLQYVMGHSDIYVTLNTYTHFKFEDAQEEMLRFATS